MSVCKNKAALARKLCVARSTLYYQPKKPRRDERIRKEIIDVLQEHPAYGHRRIATQLKMNKKKVLRAMRLFGLKPRLTRRKPRKSNDHGNIATTTANIAKTLCPITPNILWAGDFTYLPWHGGGFVYLATVLDVYTREIVGWHLGLKHTTELVAEALNDALVRTRTKPKIFHSDQGSEYQSERYERLLKKHHITPSHTNKSSPWENGYQESFYSGFKLEFGDPKYYKTTGELAEAVHQQIHYYNNRRIHTALKMPPAQFLIQYQMKQKTAYSAN